MKICSFQRSSVFKTLILILISLSFLITGCNSNEQKTYNEKGVLTSILHFNNNKVLDGTSVWFYASGIKQMEATYKNGGLHGPQIRYYENGIKQEVTYYKNNLIDSISSHYGINGDLLLIETYRNDTLNGVYQRYYENGKVAIDGLYENGLMQGNWLFYDQSGFVNGKATFIQGSGIQKAWHPNGKLQRVIHYEKNLKHGKEEFYSIDGNLEKIIHYEKGTIIPDPFEPKVN